MVSPVITERRHSGGFLVSEAQGERSRDQVTLLQQVPPNPPGSPSLSGSSSGGSLATGTVYVKTTYTSPLGETLPSAEASQSVTGPNGEVTVTALTGNGNANGYNVYAAAASGAEFLVNTAGPIALGANYTFGVLPTGGISPPSMPPQTRLPAGLILGETEIGGSATYAANAGNTGNFTCGSIAVGQGAVEGTYGIEFIAATVFNVSYPNGELVGEGHTGAAFLGGGLGFTITAGGTAAVAGDGATIAMASNSNAGDFAPLNLAAADGTQTGAAILFNETDASGGNRLVTVIDRECEVNGSELIYPAAATAAQIAAINAQLTALGIIIR